uniref:AAA ATPase domain-containing protein n=1 Tax=Candidatus Kentrum sp. TC TaxID=2126339 RepID=A0A450ZLC2_9GAMM|nr:MAG: AAA ATPase domain-containing protein [Candidatus Kentron sp. TC]
MKIQIDNFGPIHRFECDLDKDLHLILGTNNIGKSYAITVVYLLLKSFIEARKKCDFSGFNFDEEDISDDMLDKRLVQQSEEEAVVMDILKGRIAEALAKEVLEQFQHYFRGTYNSINAVDNKFSREELRIDLQFDEIDISVGIVEGTFRVKELTIKSNTRLIYKKVSRNERKQILYVLMVGDKKKYIRTKLRLYAVYSLLCRKVFVETRDRISNIHYLPASRSGLYAALSAFGQIFAELAKSRAFLKSGIELPGIAVPVSDYFLELSQIDPNQKREQDDPIQRIAEDIENHILKGKVEFDKETRKLFYTPDGSGGLRLDMDATSSMVSELSPIVSFLRYIISKPARKQRALQSLEIRQEGSLPQPLLFIEEPEAHLHPENQVRLMAAFAALANAGVKVMLTTHSDFLFNKLNNLILEKRIDTAAVSAMLFKQTDKGGEAVPLAMDDLGIEDENFIDATERLYDEKVDLIDRMNRDGDDGDAE